MVLKTQTKKLLIGMAIIISCLLLVVWIGDMILGMINSWIGTAIPCCH